ncbi:hemolymph lipopolysaccharide-binding protein-like [Spodoptera frugiperda]|uniref:Hemolymph lipopolysaccharide-binding protein-like n=1 Tax=Spodoptera frugiperda TaxID=7108 RepID=A0A9R0DUT1_SPOFR|nr:hemolymph lipopolysaccharide-binding protein-like [Spodoptera frugiperda]
MKTGVKYSVIWIFSLFCYIEATFRCDYTYSKEAKGWFKHVVIPATWADARLHCTLEGATLASPLNQAISNEMQSLLANLSALQSEVFTGIHATVSRSNLYHTIEGIPLSKIPLDWATNEPNGGRDENCITFNSDGQAADRSCKETRPYICYRHTTKVTVANECGTVDPEYNLDKRTGSCYKFHTVPRTFERANFACSAEGGHLAIINSDVEAAVLKELFERNPPAKMFGTFWKDVAFIGFHDWGEYGDWRTIHGQTLVEAGYSKFSSGEPNNSSTGEFCGSIYRNGMLNDLWCGHPKPFICEKDPKYPAVCCVTESEPELDPTHFLE